MRAVPRRRCPRCKKNKPETRGYFYFKSDGNWDTWCKVCKKEWNRIERETRRRADYKRRAGLRLTMEEERAADAAERQRAAQRRYMKKVRSDEALKASHAAAERKWREANREQVRERSRMTYRLTHERKLRPSADRTYYNGRLSRAERNLPAEPFAQWIEDTFGKMAHIEAPDYLGLSPREVAKLVAREMETVTLPTVDRAFVTYGRPDLLERFYPIGTAS